MRITDELLIAYADGELHGPQREAVERALAEDEGLRARLDQQQRVRHRLVAHYGPTASEDVPERLLALLGASATRNGVASLADAREKKRRARGPGWLSLGAVAASLMVGVLAGQHLPRQAGPIASEGGLLVAAGPLSKALDTQLASTQAPEAPTRIGITFADHQGRTCRTFDAERLSGLACRQGEQWHLVMTAAAERTRSEYQQAGSAAVMETAQEMMAGPALDAEAERVAMNAGWKIPGQPRD